MSNRVTATEIARYDAFRAEGLGPREAHKATWPAQAALEALDTIEMDEAAEKLLAKIIAGVIA